MKKILANSAILTLLVALVLGLSMTSCTPKSDKATLDEVKATVDMYTKSFNDFDNWAKGLQIPPDPAALDMLNGQIDAKFKPVADAQKKWADMYEKTWKPKLAPEDITMYEKQVADLGTKAKASLDGLKKKLDDAKKAMAAAPAEGAPAPEAPKK
jgi:hypothetical protein